MSTHNYLDDLDNLLDDPKTNLASAPLVKGSQAPSHEEASSVTRVHAAVQADPSHDEAHQASQTWADVIEAASRALHEGTQLSQEATRKNIELAKEQQESIKELSDAASGWRHATRQAVQEVSATKKNIIILTLISGLIAVAGFGTTIGVMLQSRASFVSMSNAILENVDEHQTIVSKTLTLKLDELASTIEQMQASIEQMKLNKIDTTPSTASSESPQDGVVASVVEDTPTQANNATEPTLMADANHTVASAPVMTPNAAPAPSPILAPTTAVTPAEPVQQNNNATVAKVTAPSAEAWQQLLTQVDQLSQQLQQMEQNAIAQAQAQNQQWQQVASQMDEKLAARLAKLPTPAAETGKTTPNVTAVVDTKPIMDQLTRLRQEMAELRLLQQSLKEQMSQVKQSVTESANKPYQYRLPQEGERYPR